MICRKTDCPVPAPAARAYATLVKDAVADSYNDRERQALTFFTGKGWKPHQAVAIVASLKKESFLDPGAVQDDGPGRGIAQWPAADTRTATYARLHPGKTIFNASYAQQLEFVNYELHNPVLAKDATLTDTTYLKAGNELRKTATLETAVATFLADYERASAKDQIAERAAIAREIYRYWSKMKGFFPTAGR